ncbi:hypothetical protein [Actinomadura sp. HBU206391]|uniref:hypothetical protein n=1 Tax=Actinomadura sp. HBU206391 TaxID=2731692 RepID=UPI0016509768|nr:hypothetical protein [Actinomadura sp. HBU206391]MBC6462552.1 hypothetical protein [Actinomadura sp. HBU206391]
MIASGGTAVLGKSGSLSYLAQLTTQRQVSRNEANRHAKELAERRRAERLEVLQEFIQATQQAERAAGEKEDSSEWWAASEDAMDRLWVQGRMIYLLFGPSLYEPAHAYARALNQAMNREMDPDGAASRWAFIEVVDGPKIAFLAAAHTELG